MLEPADFLRFVEKELAAPDVQDIASHNFTDTLKHVSRGNISQKINCFQYEIAPLHEKDL
jgi:hypothetical protein